jgi:hypothetical protein
MLDDNTILQTDATIIAGLLILLSITVTYGTRLSIPMGISVWPLSKLVHPHPMEVEVPLIFVLITTVVLFSASAILVAFGNSGAWGNCGVTCEPGVYSVSMLLIDLGKYAMMVGFFVLAVGVSFLLWARARAPPKGASEPTGPNPSS